MDGQESAFLLGKLDGKLDQVIKSQEQQAADLKLQDAKLNGRLDSIEVRLRNVEISEAKSGAISGAISGSVVSIGIALIVEGFKAYFVKH